MATSADLAELLERSESVEIVRTVSFDWYDGPRRGFVWLSEPRSAWYFTLWAEAPRSDDVDDRLYALAALPDDGERIIARVLSPLNPPSSKSWIPDWRFPSEDQRVAADAALDALIESLEAPSVVLRSAYLDQIDAVWLVVPPPQHS